MSSPGKSRTALPSLALALAASLSCTGGGTVKALPQIVLSANSLDFGDVPVLNTATQTLTIDNLGRAPLTLTSIALADASAPFSLGTVPTSVDPGASAQLQVSFVPPALATYATTLAVQSDDADHPQLTVSLTGNGLTAATMLADATLDFGVVCEGAESIATAAVRSTGTADLIVQEVQFAPGTAPEFQFVSSTRTPATVAMGGSLSLAVKVSPTASSPPLLTGGIVVGGTDPANRSATIALSAKVNRAPIAVVAPPANAAPGATITLDGSGSSDPDGDLPLAFSWALKSSPIGSSAQPKPLDQPQTSLTLDLPGQYTVALTVKDALGCASQPVFQDVLAKPAKQLLVELVWDNLDADLDLHLVPDGDAFFGPQDCYFAAGHTSPDWGNPSGGPTLDRDALTGYGPEIISYGQPLAGRYDVMAYYFSTHASTTPKTVATIRVYEFGIVKAELSQTLYAAGQQWLALDIDWPSGSVTTVNEVQ